MIYGAIGNKSFYLKRVMYIFERERDNNVGAVFYLLTIYYTLKVYKKSHVVIFDAVVYNFDLFLFIFFYFFLFLFIFVFIDVWSSDRNFSLGNANPPLEVFMEKNGKSVKIWNV